MVRNVTGAVFRIKNKHEFFDFGLPGVLGDAVDGVTSFAEDVVDTTTDVVDTATGGVFSGLLGSMGLGSKKNKSGNSGLDNQTLILIAAAGGAALLVVLLLLKKRRR